MMEQFSFGSIVIYYLLFAELAAKMARYRTYLSSDEQSYAAKFYFERDREKFILARGYLRELLGRRLGLAPEQLQFTYGRFGKPYLLGQSLNFNMAHNQQALIIAMSSIAELGVDIEHTERKVDYLGIAKHAFSVSERHYLASEPLAKQAMAFYRCWTRKEAFVKAVGLGIISFDLTTLGLTSANDTIIGIDYAGQHWRIHDLPVCDGNRMALVLNEGYNFSNF